MLLSFREDTVRALKKANEEGEGIRGEIRVMNEKWEKWENEWEEEKRRMQEGIMDIGETVIEMRKEQKTDIAQANVRLTRLEEKLSRMDELEELVKGLRLGGEESSGRAVSAGEASKENEQLKRRVWELEWKKEKKVRERRKWNLIVRKFQVGKRDGREEVEKLFTEVMQAQGVLVKGVKKFGGGVDKKERGSVVVELENKEQKRWIMGSRASLKGRQEVLDHDRTRKERKMLWNLEKVEMVERARNSGVAIRRGMIWVNGVRWRYDEATEKLYNVKEEEWRMPELREQGKKGNMEAEAIEVQEGTEKAKEGEQALGEQ
ncbi:golgin subfamily A member 6-like protein 1 [Diachasmimorpha longicaudata]|uniref:golgin subfamily A member 6-like protein 1 n=1 Tax=Diachasmimorpha longicaudata TaxID=58733 RepID=UPI0030B86EAF